MNHKPLSTQLHDLLSGKVAWDDASDTIRNWAQFEIYKGAVAALALPTKEERRTFLDKIPETIRPQVEAETMRVWKWRRENDA